MLAAATPLAFSLVGDLFSAEDRANAGAHTGRDKDAAVLSIELQPHAQD